MRCGINLAILSSSDASLFVRFRHQLHWTNDSTSQPSYRRSLCCWETLLLSMRLKTAYSLPCLCNSEGPRLVNTAVFDPFLLRKFPTQSLRVRNLKLESDILHVLTAGLRSMFRILIFCDATWKILGEEHNRRTLLWGFRASEGFGKWDATNARSDLLKALAWI